MIEGLFEERLDSIVNYTGNNVPKEVYAHTLVECQGTLLADDADKFAQVFDVDGTQGVALALMKNETAGILGLGLAPATDDVEGVAAQDGGETGTHPGEDAAEDADVFVVLIEFAGREDVGVGVPLLL